MSQPVRLSQVLAVPDIMDINRYLLYFGSIPGGGDAQSLSLKCFSASMPQWTNQAYDVHLGGHNLNFRGKRDFSQQLAVGFYEDRTGDSLRRLRTWHEMVVGTESGNSAGYIDDYSVPCRLDTFDTAGAIVHTHDIFRCYPFSIQELNLDSQASAPMQVMVDFRFTWFKSNTHVVR